MKAPVHPRPQPATALLALALATVCTAAASADAMLDFNMFQVQPNPDRYLAQPKVRWLLHPQAASQCQRVTPQDGHAQWHESCVAWHRDSNTCTIYTTAMTTHSALGHAIVSCLRGR